MMYVDCPECFTGNHAGHVRDWNIRPGLIGGERCGCEGDCEQRARKRFDAWMIGGNEPEPVEDPVYTEGYERLIWRTGQAFGVPLNLIDGRPWVPTTDELPDARPSFGQTGLAIVMKAGALAGRVLNRVSRWGHWKWYEWL